MKFQELKRREEGALITYTTLGFPTIEESKEIVKILARHSDIIELGIPFSDPIADGPTIQKAIDIALRNGINTDICFEIVKDLRKEIETPFVFMTYYNIVLQYGIERFIKRCKEVGVDGILVVDLPLEEAGEVLKLCYKYNVHFIFLVALNTYKERLLKILNYARGFIYLIAFYGVTGAREEIEEETLRKIRFIKENASIPLAVGFGVSKPEHVVRYLSAGADGVVIGSKLIDIIMRNREYVNVLDKFLMDLKNATRIYKISKTV